MKSLLYHFLVAAIAGAPPPSGIQSDIFVGGDKNPDSLEADFKATCGSHKVRITILNSRDNPTKVPRVEIDEINYVNRPEYAELRGFIGGMRVLYVNNIVFPTDAVAISLAGIPVVGNDNFYRVTIPIPR